MPPKKRAATATKPTAPGKAKRQKVSKASHERKEAAVDLSAQNAIQSPLFRLPAELRDVIWRLIFGEMVIEVTSKHNAQPDHAPEMKYRLLKDVSDTQRHGTKRAFGPQLVCKQYWFEASEVLISSCTFMFHAPRYFQDFVLSGQNVVSQVRRVKMSLVLHGTTWQRNEMTQTFSASAVGELKNLEGVHFKFYCWMHESPARWNSNLMKDASWVRSKLPVVLRAFQQHPLKKELTKVTPKYNNSDRMPELCARIRGHLLEHHPRRTSGRRSR